MIRLIIDHRNSRQIPRQALPSAGKGASFIDLGVGESNCLSCTYRTTDGLRFRCEAFVDGEGDTALCSEARKEATACGPWAAAYEQRAGHMQQAAEEVVADCINCLSHVDEALVLAEEDRNPFRERHRCARFVSACGGDTISMDAAVAADWRCGEERRGFVPKEEIVTA